MREGVIAILPFAAGCHLAFGFDGEVPPAADADADAELPAECATLPEFDIELPSTPSSRFAISTDARTLADYVARCKMASPSGYTHLYAPTSRVQLEEMIEELPRLRGANEPVYIGAVQKDTASIPVDDWFTVVGDPLLRELWGDGEPNDTGGTTEQKQEQFAALRYIGPAPSADDGLSDTTAAREFGAICECDARIVDPELEALLLVD